MNWQQLSLEQIRTEYTIEVPNRDEISARYRELNEQLLSDFEGHLDVPYADGGTRQMLDLFVPGTEHKHPVMVFIHGGYWRVNSKDDRRFPAAAFLSEGIAWVPINYRLAPNVNMDEIVQDGRQAIAWLYKNAGEFNCDPERIYVCGNSAGGHMVGMLSADGWQSDFGLPEDVVKGGCALSGLFDLEPLLHAEPNDWLKMDRETALRNSPIYSLPKVDTRLVITCGSEETSEFRRQSYDYAELAKDAGVDVNYFEMQGDNHFSIIGKLADKNSQLFTSIVEMINR